ncbi:hypothetical protein DAEQUDRAFT_730726 [Daedalea quercina L-15889]|uniref:Uncharacterized protein n=1 Tax=Daedalea quercina L-15889 TaxID=1314783 RepID=A0A165MTA0_9APHY|nr:hypothetical protein DAEQUDRAFT_730726 [Daedalea quercina L-15889]
MNALNRLLANNERVSRTGTEDRIPDKLCLWYDYIRTTGRYTVEDYVRRSHAGEEAIEGNQARALWKEAAGVRTTTNTNHLYRWSISLSTNVRLRVRMEEILEQQGKPIHSIRRFTGRCGARLFNARCPTTQVHAQCGTIRDCIAPQGELLS